MTVSASGTYVKVESSTPLLELKGTEGSAIDFKLQENGGKVEMYSTSTLIRTLYPEDVVIHIRTIADSAAGDTWERSAFYAPASTAWVVQDAGIVPDVAFGQATNYATIALRNKGTGGSGTTVIATRDFDTSSEAPAYDYTSLGTISNATIAAGEVLAFQKTVTSSGEIVPASLLVVVLRRSA